MHGLLTSLLDPDAVTDRAFAEQQKRLDAMVKSMSRDDFYGEIVGRLGSAQARVLTTRYYGRKA